MIQCTLRHVDKLPSQSGKDVIHALTYLPLPPGHRPVAVGHLYASVPPSVLEKVASDPSSAQDDISPYILRGTVGLCRMCHAVHCTLTAAERYAASMCRMLGKTFVHHVLSRSLSQIVHHDGAFHNLFNSYVRPYLTPLPELWNIPRVGYVWYSAAYNRLAPVKDACWQYGPSGAATCEMRWLLQSVLWPWRNPNPRLPPQDNTTYFGIADMEWVAELILQFIMGIQNELVSPASVIRKRRLILLRKIKAQHANELHTVCASAAPSSSSSQRHASL